MGMGRHTGYFVKKLPSGAFQGWARDPGTKTYAKATGTPEEGPFRTEAQARAWAKARHSDYDSKVKTRRDRGVETKDIATSYQAYLRDIKQRTDSHLANVKRCLDGLTKAMPDPSHPRALIQCEEWLAGLDVAPGTKIQYLDTAKAMFNWAVPRKMISENPLAIAETIERPKEIKAQFTVEELRSMVRACDDPFHLHACLFVYLGLRIEETVTTAWSGGIGGALDHSNDFAYIVGKGSKARLVLKPSELRPILDWYRPPAQFRSEPACPLTTATTRRHFYMFLQRLQITKGQRTVHSTRHSYAGVMTGTGVPTATLSENMGHSSEGTTREYAKLAKLYGQQVDGWPRGEFRLLTGATCPHPKPPPKSSGILHSPPS